MVVFYVLATVMALVAIAFVLWPLLRPSGRARVERQAANVSIYRDQFADLEADLARGTLSSDQHAEARAELERRMLEESRQDAAASSAAPARSRLRTATALALAVPLAAGLLYWHWGDPGAISLTTVATSDGHKSTEQIDQMVEQLAQRLQKQPDNAEGWFVLARSYYAMGKFAEASTAFAKVVALVPNDANVLADYADALAMSRGRNLSGPPEELIERALKIDPTQWKALAMAGTIAFERKDYVAAVGYWERLRATQPADSPLAKSIQGSIAEARELGKLGGEVASASPPEKAKPTAGTAEKAVSGTVRLSPALATKAAPNDTVFVFARPNDGSKMPLAVVRAQVKDLPLKFTLDDTRAMSPAAKISMHELVVVAARVARGGNVAAQSGDLEGPAQSVKVGSRDLILTIDQIVP